MTTLDNALNEKNILLGITGGIAAYKSAALCRLLVKQGANVHVVMTKTAKEFITPLTMQTLSGNVVYDDLFALCSKMSVEHIELARWANVILIAPATANFIAKLAHGFANDILSTICLAAEVPIAVAPAMNKSMWKNNVTQQNIQALRERNIAFFGPEDGTQACGEIGLGRMLEPEEILTELTTIFPTPILTGKHVLITAGPTIEPIDPVRYISNYSSGKMGFALAQAAVVVGAEVTLITGPVSLSAPQKVKRVNVKTAQQMHAAVMQHAEDADIFIAAAAVGDYRLAETSPQKIKKTQDALSLKLTKNPDVLASVSSLKKHRPYIVGFAAESNNLVKNAQEKLKKKNLDMIIANLINIPGQGFESDNNKLTVLFNEQYIEMPLDSKYHLARRLILLITKQINMSAAISAKT